MGKKEIKKPLKDIEEISEKEEVKESLEIEEDKNSEKNKFLEIGEFIQTSIGEDSIPVLNQIAVGKEQTISNLERDLGQETSFSDKEEDNNKGYISKQKNYENKIEDKYTSSELEQNKNFSVINPERISIENAGRDINKITASEASIIPSNYPKQSSNQNYISAEKIKPENAGRDNPLLKREFEKEAKEKKYEIY